MQKGGYVYILASKKRGTLYIGVTSDLVARIYQHKTEYQEGFTKQHNVKILVWFESFPTIEEAIQQEKRLKKWNRLWKIELIEQSNPEWLELNLTP